MSYRFQSAFPQGHFVADYVEYASQLCDAAHDYHEACGLAMLAVATPDVVATDVRQFPEGLRTNLYLVLQGTTSTSRKSTSKDLMVDVLRRAFPHLALLPDKATPEAFASELSIRPRQASLWASDEYATVLKQMRRRDYMAGLESLLLELYQRSDYVYKRVKDKVEIKDSHLTIVGCAADTVFEHLHKEDVESGLLPRHAIIMPSTKPDYMGFGATTLHLNAHRNGLVQRLANLGPKRDAAGCWTTRRDVRITDAAFDRVTEFGRAHEQQHSGEMQRRMVAMLLKVGMLAALGEPAAFLLTSDLVVDLPDMERAVMVINRWSGFATDFTERLSESEHLKQVRIVEDRLRKLNLEHVKRNELMRALHFDARSMDAVEATLEGQGKIQLFADPKAQTARRCAYWKWLDSGSQRQP